MKRFIISLGILLLVSMSHAYLPGTLEDGLVGYWRMENDTSDYLGQYNGTLSGSPTYTASGHLGGAYSFDGIDDYIDIPSAVSTMNGLSEGSISAWFKFNNPSDADFRPVLYLGTSGTDETDGVIIELGHPGYDSVNNLYFTTNAAGSSSPVQCFDTNNAVSVGEWHHFVATVSSSGNTGYLDGAEMTNRRYNFGNSSSTLFFDDVTDADIFTIGYGNYAVDIQFYYFNGTIDEVGIWNRSISASEVSDLYSMTTSTTTTSTSTSTTSTSTSTSTTTLSTDATCSSCDDCSSKLTGTYETVKLTTDLQVEESGCIQFYSAPVDFDCQGHTISGDETGGFGLNIVHASSIHGPTVRNCVIRDFWYGIRLENAYSITLINNTIISNNQTGIDMRNSFYITIENNTITKNLNGLLISGSNNPNYIRGNTINSNTWIGLYLTLVDYSRVNENEVCYNAESDFWFTSSDNNTGTNNTCDNPHDWNDDGTTGCTYSCSAVTTTTTSTSTSTTLSGDCTLVGDTAPCGTITLAEVIDLIGLWAAEGAELSDVIDLINAWST